MKQITFHTLHWLVHVALLILLISLQSSLWPMLLGPFPPLLWLVPVVYFALYFPAIPAFCYVFSMAFLVSFASSGAPFVFVFSLGSLAGVFAYFRQHIFWVGPTYLALAVMMATVLYPPLTWVASQMVDTHPLAYPHWLPWIFQVLLTPWVAFLLYKPLTRLDRVLLSEGLFRSLGAASE